MTFSRQIKKGLQSGLSEGKKQKIIWQEQESVGQLHELDRLFYLSHDLLCIAGIDGYFKRLNPAFTKILGYPLKELKSKPFLSFIHPDDQVTTLQAIEKQMEGIPVHRLENRYRCRNGSYKWLEWKTATVTKEGLLYAVGRDISQDKLIAADLHQEKELTQVILKSIGDGVITTDAQGKINYLNPVAEKLTSWSKEAAKGRYFGQIFQLIDEKSRELLICPVEQILQSDQGVEVFLPRSQEELCLSPPVFSATEKKLGLLRQAILIARDGKEHTIAQSVKVVRDRDNKIASIVVIFHDITKSKELTHQLCWQENHDILTGLLNRNAFEQNVIQAIVSVKHDPYQQAIEHHHTLLFLNLDRFKIINDICGYLAGDRLLAEISHILKQRIRSTDILARIGGDQFGILLKQCPLSQAEMIADNIRRLIQESPFIWKGKTFTLSVSIGIVVIDTNTKDFSDVLSAADTACYAAKQRGRNCFHIYRSDDSELVKYRGEKEWISRLNQALLEERFCLYSQKITPLKEKCGKDHYEILLRLLDEEGNLVPPMTFIPAAERYDLMPAIDRWVIKTFFSIYAQHCQQQNTPILTDLKNNAVYTINISGTSINNEQFLDFVKEQFTIYPISPNNICFEITETTAIANLSKAAELIAQLKQLGCSFALDDFGSGMSSLVYLKNLPVDYLKIDGSFVKNIVDDPVDSATVECFSRISRVMNIQTIAEFVENEATIAKLRELGVDYGQGYAIAKPCPLSFIDL